MTKIDTEELYAFNQLLKESKEGLDLKFKQSDIAIADFSKEGKLTGGAWSSAKNHFDKGYTPLIDSFDSALVLLVDKFSDYTTEFRQQVTGGSVALDTDQLQDLEIRMQNLASYKVQWLLDMADQLAGIPGIGKFFDEVSLNSTKKEVILLRKFQEFEHSHRNEFDEIAEALHFLRIGLEAVGNKKNFQGATKGFGPIDFNKDSWASNLSKFNERNKDKIDHIKKYEAESTAAVIEMTAQIQNAQMNMNSMNDAMMEEVNSTNSYNYNPLGGKTWFHPEEMEIKKNSNSVNVELTQNSVNSKLKGYLLNKEHPVGGSKANWFEKALGFNQTNSNQLSNQIKFDQSKATQTAITDYGVKFSQIIPITGPNGKTIKIEFVWIKNNDGIVRLVTSIPTKK
ncbi:T7SS effector LXG polymorphic toxin [Carnobacterium maltaromaticum]|uniref:DUF6883 domain-containing protein n=1 Tax=Carnobacterium maltaromaticum TaxID=2751 RepID=UPI00298B45CD|nr:DUF6883 domain-containing protein [Carnobacterium maltaromaticum]MDW5524976.1 T7SS effector LXG polymorphic toxin [Carnobacterium maltaromaticum]